MRIKCFVLLIGLIGCCRADDFSSIVVNNYVREMFDTPDFQSRWKRSEHYVRERNDPNGGYFFRFGLEFEPSTDRFLFIASDRFGEVNLYGSAWHIYREQEGQDLEVIARSKLINVGIIYIDHPTRSLVQRHKLPSGEGGNFSILKFGPDGSVESDYYQSDEIDEAMKASLESLGIHFVPEVEKIPIAAYLRSPELEWRPIDFSFSFSAQSLDEGDKPLLELAADLSWEEAVPLANSLTGDLPNSRPPSDDALDTELETDETSGAAVEPPSREPDNQPPSIRASEDSGFPKWAVLIGGILIIGVVALLFKIYSSRNSTL